MPKQTLMLSPLKKAITALQIAINQPKNEFTRDATIQRFEYTFELAWKMLKRHLTKEAGLEEYSLKNLFREAGRLGLIENTDNWFSYLEARNLTSHTYNEETAEETYRVAKNFAPDALKLLNQLEKFYGNTAS
jgi:nucleotidyltransferase substrate binding protein (TIGR01987 family)